MPTTTCAAKHTLSIALSQQNEMNGAAAVASNVSLPRGDAYRHLNSPGLWSNRLMDSETPFCYAPTKARLSISASRPPKYFLESSGELNHLNFALVSFPDDIDVGGPLDRSMIVIAARLRNEEGL